MMRNGLTDIPLLKIFVRKGGVRIALRAMRTPPLRKEAASSPFFFSLKSKILRKKNKINKKLSGILYQNYTAVLYHFKTAVNIRYRPRPQSITSPDPVAELSDLRQISTQFPIDKPAPNLVF